MTKRPKKNILESGSPRERQLRARIDDLEKELAYMRALKTPVRELPKDQAHQVTRLVKLFLDYNEAANPLRSNPIEAQHGYKHPDSSLDEGAATRWAREQADRLTNRIRTVCNEYEQRYAGEWKPVPRVPRIECGNPKCSAYGTSVPRYIGANSTIELINCPRCDHPMQGQGDRPPPPRARCWNRSCSRYSRTYLIECDGCGSKPSLVANVAVDG